ncbi:hypothetical protein VP01_3094g2 [Puccinia sorghi]|uniref:CxC1-like cysteine cluster associated with KDZ transposases domain-containing protein n=1 Tax=Puccinia sorghi TaxID=27349 RepID=A0A0L6UZN6_9BASI|nr:hypothetical protein VP01_3094g2 [Puccinia sorghi]
MTSRQKKIKEEKTNASALPPNIPCMPNTHYGLNCIGKKCIGKTFCSCLPNFFRFLETWNMASTPSHPWIAFSVQLLQFLNLEWQGCNFGKLTFTKISSCWLEER